VYGIKLTVFCEKLIFNYKPHFVDFFRNCSRYCEKHGICYRYIVLLQSEKAKMLMDHEVLKLQELDNQYESELRDWKQNLRFRKQVHLSPLVFLSCIKYVGGGLVPFMRETRPERLVVILSFCILWCSFYCFYVIDFHRFICLFVHRLFACVSFSLLATVFNKLELNH